MADDDRLSRAVGVALKAEEYEVIERMAEADDRPVAYIARQLIREALERRASAPESRR